MNIKFLILVILCSLLLISCEKDLDINDFEDEFGDYQSELKVEALLQQDKPDDSIVRITRTSPITDSDIHNGIDDDGDSLIDEYDEILELIQDTSATVTVTNLNSGQASYFQYVAMADSFINSQEENMHTHIFIHEHDGAYPDTIIYEHSHPIIGGDEMVSYGGYKPTSPDFQIEAYAPYQIEIYSSEFDRTITGETTIYPAVDFIDSLYTFQDSVVFLNPEGRKDIFWKSDLNVTAYYITYEELVFISEDEWEFEFLFSYLSSRDNDLTDRYGAVSIGRVIIGDAEAGTVIRLTIEALSPDYGQYLFSELPLNDPQRSNLRDQDGQPVMGCFGATAAKQLYIVFNE